MQPSCHKGNYLSSNSRHNRNKSTVVTSLAEFNGAIGQCKQGPVFTNTNIFAGMVNGAPLTNEDIAIYCGLTAKDFNAQTLALRVAAVLYTTFTFLVCHGMWSLGVLNE